MKEKKKSTEESVDPKYYLIISLGFFIVLFTIFAMKLWVYEPRDNPISIKDQNIILDFSLQIRPLMSYIYGQDSNYDFFNCYHEDMRVLCQDVDKNYGKEDGQEPVIAHDTQANSQSVCIYSPLNTEGNYWYCADSKGNVGRTSIDPGSTGYCIEGESAICPPFIED